MHLLDIGGGFPGSEDVKLKFEEVQLCRTFSICVDLLSITWGKQSLPFVLTCRQTWKNLPPLSETDPPLSLNSV